MGVGRKGLLEQGGSGEMRQERGRHGGWDATGAVEVEGKVHTPCLLAAVSPSPFSP